MMSTIHFRYSSVIFGQLLSKIGPKRPKKNQKQQLATMTNQFHYMLIKTDPVIASISFVKHRNANGKPLPQDVLDMLK